LLAAAPKQTPPAASKAEDAEKLRTQATKLYRARKYDQACPLYERAVQLAPEHGPTLADWGLCLQRQGKRDEARKADLRALAASDGAPKTRAGVYFNLSEFHDATPREIRLESHPYPRGFYLDIAAGGPCAPLPSSEPGCTQALFACVELWSAAEEGPYGPVRHASPGRWNLRLFRSAEDGRKWRQGDDVKEGCPNAPAPANPEDPPPRQCIYWAAEESQVDCAGNDEACIEEARAVSADQGTCALVYVNPCTGRVAVSCEGSRFQGLSPKGNKGRWVGEVTLQPVP
jgi:hypothetical protein